MSGYTIDYKYYCELQDGTRVLIVFKGNDNEGNPHFVDENGTNFALPQYAKIFGSDVISKPHKKTDLSPRFMGLGGNES
jgi:hypothetical protein